MKALQYITATVLATVVLFTSCKPDDDIKPNGGSANLEQLGDLKPNYVAFQYNGDPVITISNNNFLYEWSSSEKKWSKIDAELPAGFFHNLVQDDQGNYYCAAAGPFSVYTLPKNGTSWELITLPEYTGTDNLATIVVNGVGDIIIRIIKSSKYVYYKKTGSGSWSKIKEIPQSEEANATIQYYPYYLSDNGILFYSNSTTANFGSSLTDRVFNINTNSFAKLYDKDAPENLKYVSPDGVGTLEGGGHYITSQGTVYTTYQNVNGTYIDFWKVKVLKISPTTFPAPISEMWEFDVPDLHGDGSGWRSGVDIGVVDANENLKTSYGCSKYPESHVTTATVQNGKSKVDVHNHDNPYATLTRTSNRKNEMFLIVNQGYLYKWK